MNVALERGFSLSGFWIWWSNSAGPIPVSRELIFLNPIEIFGYEKFAVRAEAAGIDGVIIVDLPPEEAVPLNRHLRDRQIDQFSSYSHNHGAAH